MNSSIEPVLVKELQKKLKNSFFSFLASSMDVLEMTYGNDYLIDAERYLQLLKKTFPSKNFIEWALDGFITFNREILKEEKVFKEKGHYSAGVYDFERVCNEVYKNPDIMKGYYLVGMFLSYFCWQHHYELLSFYRKNFLESTDSIPHTVMEWGVGHGLLTLLALSSWPKVKSIVYDISPYSLKFSQKLFFTAGYDANCKYRIGDVLKESVPCVDRLICGELLEHVPDPKSLMNKVYRSLRPGGLAFVTGAVNSAQHDHVYLFRSPEEIYSLANECNLNITSSIAVVHPSRKGHELEPTVVAMILESTR